MNIDTIINAEKKLKFRIVDIFNGARIYKPTFRNILESVKRDFYNDNQYKRLPRYAKEYLRGYLDCQFDNLWKELVWTHEVNGVRFISKDKPDHISWQDINDNTENSCHCWKQGKDKKWHKYN